MEHPDLASRQCCSVYSAETHDDGVDLSKHVEFFIKMNLRNSASR